MMDTAKLKKNKIAIFNTYANSGGAAIAANRQFQLMLGQGFNLSFINKVGEKSNGGVLFKGFLGTLRHWYTLILERIKFLHLEKNRNIRWNFSPSNVGSSMVHRNAIMDAALFHFHWINHAFISLKELKSMMAMNKPVIITMHDMWWITGGCHHSRGCNNFKNECGNCHFLISPSANDCSHLHFKTKLGMISSSRPTVITPSHWLAKTVAESAIGKYVDLTVIPNGIDLQIYKPQTVNINLELDSQKRIILFIAANASSPYKGVHYLIDAINAMPDENLHLVVIGTVKDPKIFNRLKISYTLKGKISNKELLIAYYNRADVFMLPSLEENLPNTIIEAMACGTPALAFDTGGVSEIIDHCINGYVARYKDTADLTVGLKFILTADKSGLSAAAVSKIKSSFANDVVAQKLAELYLTKLAANV